MNNYVADTMAIVLYLENRKSPSSVKRIFNDAENSLATIYISVVSLMEIGYLYEKQRIETSISTVLQLADKYRSFKLLDLDTAIVSKAFQLIGVPGGCKINCVKV